MDDLCSLQACQDGIWLSYLVHPDFVIRITVIGCPDLAIEFYAAHRFVDHTIAVGSYTAAFEIGLVDSDYLAIEFWEH